MRRHAAWAMFAGVLDAGVLYAGVLLAVLLLAACSSSDGKSSSTSSAPSSAGVTTSAPTTTDPVVTAQSTSTSQAPTTTMQPCPPSPRGTAAYTTPAASTSASVLTGFTVTGERCGDLALFGFQPHNGAPPRCNVAYKNGPFTQDGSGKPVTVKGHAFLVVRCEPASTLDPETEKTTYIAPADKHTVPEGATHVVDTVATGDFEGVMSWVLGLDAQRPFHADATGAGALVISVF
jgi:hypothetical protein